MMPQCEKCGKSFKTDGGLRLHKPHCKGSEEGDKCPECGSDIRLLDPSNPQEKQAMKMGYAGICDKCKEVI